MASPSPSLRGAATLRLRIRSHAPLPREQFVFPVSMTSSDAAETTLEDLSSKLSKALEPMGAAASSPIEAMLAMYLDRFRLVDAQTAITEVLRDGDIVDVYHPKHLPQPPRGKRKRTATMSSSSDSSSSSSVEAPNDTKRSRGSSSKRLKQSEPHSDAHVQEAAHRIALLIKSEIGSESQSHLHSDLDEGEEKRSDHSSQGLLSPPAALRATVNRTQQSKVGAASASGVSGVPSMPLPPSAGLGPANAMAAFEARKKEIQIRDASTGFAPRKIDPPRKNEPPRKARRLAIAEPPSSPSADSSEDENSLDSSASSEAEESSEEDESLGGDFSSSDSDASSASSSTGDDDSSGTSSSSSSGSDIASPATAPLIPSLQIPSELTRLRQSQDLTPASRWVKPGQGSNKTHSNNVRKRLKQRVAEAQERERLFEEAKARAERRAKGELIDEVPSESVQKVAPSNIVPVADSASDTSEEGSTLGWVIDTKPTAPLAPYRDPTKSALPLASIKLNATSREREIAELKEKIRIAELQRKTLPPGAGGFEMDDRVHEDSVKPPSAAPAESSGSLDLLDTSTRSTPPSKRLRSRQDGLTPPVLDTLFTPPSSKRSSKAPPSNLSDLKPDQIPPRVRISAVDCQSWYAGASSDEYLYIPGQKRPQEDEEEDEAGAPDPPDPQALAYEEMQRKIRADLAREKALEDVGVEEKTAEAASQAFPVQARPDAVSTAVNGRALTAEEIAYAAMGLPAEFGTMKTREKQLAGTSRVPTETYSQVESQPDAVIIPTGPKAMTNANGSGSVTLPNQAATLASPVGASAAASLPTIPTGPSADRYAPAGTLSPASSPIVKAAMQAPRAPRWAKAKKGDRYIDHDRLALQPRESRNGFVPVLASASASASAPVSASPTPAVASAGSSASTKASTLPPPLLPPPPQTSADPFADLDYGDPDDEYATSPPAPKTAHVVTKPSRNAPSNGSGVATTAAAPTAAAAAAAGAAAAGAGDPLVALRIAREKALASLMLKKNKKPPVDQE